MQTETAVGRRRKLVEEEEVAKRVEQRRENLPNLPDVWLNPERY